MRMNTNTHDNPAGLDGFAFLEFSGPDPSYIEHHLKQLGFTPVARHPTQAITRYVQGQISFLVNSEPETQAATHAKTHGPGACAMGFYVENAKKAYDHAITAGAKPFKEGTSYSIPAIWAIGGSVIYFVEKDQSSLFYESTFVPFSNIPQSLKGAGLETIDHLTHNVYRGNMDTWAKFYKDLFNFYQIRYFDIRGQKTGLISRALSSPCGKIKIPLNEATDDKSQIEEFLEAYHGEGIQHIALSAGNIYETVEKLRAGGMHFLEVPDTYFEMIPERLPWHTEDLPRLQKNKIIIDGDKTPEGGLLLQIFTENMFGPAFFEIIQRKKNEGFGEGNFQALFESIERDQMRRGII